MKTITLKSLSYYFRGQRRSLTFTSPQVWICGRTGTGKTTVFDVLQWILNGFDSNDKLNHNLFDNLAPSDPENPKRCEGVAEFEVDGKPLKLTKRAAQVWRRESGSETYKRAQDSYTMFVDDLQVSATEYARVIEDIFGKGDALKLMLNTAYWQMLDPKDLRKHFLSIVGEIKPEDFKNDYSEVIEVINDKGAEGARKIFNNRIRDLEKSETILNADIKAEDRKLPDLSGIDAAESRIAELLAERENIDAQLIEKRTDPAIVNKRMQEEATLSEKKTAYQLAKQTYQTEVSRKVTEVQNKLKSSQEYNKRLTYLRQSVKRQIDDLTLQKQTAEAEKKQFYAELETVTKRAFDDKCPTCGAVLSGDKREAAVVNHNAKIEADRAVIIARGKVVAARITDLEKRIKEAEAQKYEAADLAPIEAELKAAEETAAVAYVDTEDGKAKASEIATLEANLTPIPVAPDTTDLQIRKGEIEGELREQYEITAQKKIYDDTKNRIAQLKVELSQSVSAKALNEKYRDLVDEYIREINEIVRIRANRLFDNVSVEMTEVNKSSEIKDCCKLRMDGVVDTNSTGQKILIGFEVSRAFQRFYDVAMPMFIDCAGELDEDRIPQHEGQLFLLKRQLSEFEVVCE